MKNQIYDTHKSLSLTLPALIELYKTLGVKKILFKRLAPNDNSKNQPYLASHISELSFLPAGDLSQESSTSRKTQDPRRQIRYKAFLDYSWLDCDGNLYPAPGTQIIYYPQYPEVRLSGFLKNSKAGLSEWMDVKKSGRAEGRVLFLGIHPEGKIIAWLAPPHSRIVAEIDKATALEITSLFYWLQEIEAKKSGRDLLLCELRRIHLKGQIPGKKLDKNGNKKPYNAPNGGGYTLEAELGVIPNSIAEPDYCGWEIKQFGVKRFGLSASKPQTLMTPEPNGGFYVTEGIKSFILKYGYEDPKQKDRYNFNGRHLFGIESEKTHLTLTLPGFDPEAGIITDAAGSLALEDRDGTTAASWSFAKLLDHWKKKHNKAAYIPTIKDGGHNRPTYRYGQHISLFSGTTFEKFLQSVASHHVYFDPGTRIHNLSTKPEKKCRSQFRAKHRDLHLLYDKEESIDLLS